MNVLVKTYHLEQDDWKHGAHSEEDGHYDHDGSHCLVCTNDSEGSDPTTGVNRDHYVLGGERTTLVKLKVIRHSMKQG